VALPVRFRFARRLLLPERSRDSNAVSQDVSFDAQNICEKSGRRSTNESEMSFTYAVRMTLISRIYLTHHVDFKHVSGFDFVSQLRIGGRSKLSRNLSASLNISTSHIVKPSAIQVILV